MKKYKINLTSTNPKMYSHCVAKYNTRPYNIDVRGDKLMANVNVRIDGKLKKDAESIFENIGISASAAINLFYKQVVRTRSIPFSLIADEPNEETVAAIEECNSASNDRTFSSIEELRKDLEV